MNKPRQYVLALLAGLVGFAPLAATAQVRLQSIVIASGGGLATNGSQGLASTLGQAVIGPATGAAGKAWQGFWYTLPVLPTNAVPGRYPGEAVTGVALYQNVPNPFSTTTELRAQIARRCFVSLKLFDAVGHEVRTLIEGERDPGILSLQISAEKLESGYYTARLVADGVTKTIGMVVVK